LKWRKEAEVTATEHDYYRLLDELRGIPAIVFGGGGEPTLFEGYERIIDGAIDRGFLASLTTNGTKLDKLLSIDNLRKISWIGVDMDAGTKELYNEIRRPVDENDFDIVSDYVDLLVRAGATVDMKVLLHDKNDNPTAIGDIFKHAKKLGVRMVYLRPAVYDSEIYDVSLHTHEDIRKCSDFLSLPYRLNLKRTIKRTYDKCYAMYLMPAFMPDGDVYLCCEGLHKRKFKLYNWLNDYFKNHWNNEKHREIFESVDLDECRACRAITHNVEIEKILRNRKGLEDLFF
jgi:radical SAM protein with 4Fe4S-binding SPASM domain